MARPTSPQGQLHVHSSQAHPHVFGLGAASLQTSLPLHFGDSAHPWPCFTHPSLVTNRELQNLPLPVWQQNHYVIRLIEAIYYRDTIHSLYIKDIPTGWFLEKTSTASETNIISMYYRAFSHLDVGSGC